MKNCSIVFLLIFVFYSPANGQTEDTMLLDTGSGIIEGSLFLPDANPTSSVALIIPGSGPTDRDGNNTFMKNNSLKMLAQGIAKEGIASLRYDKRGVGKSLSAGVKEIDLRFENYIEDAKSWIGLLDNDQRFHNIIVIGHSEGSLIGMIASKKESVDKFISIAGVAQPAGIIIRKQLEAQPPYVLEQSLPILEKLESGEEVDSIPPMLFSLFRPSVQPYLISYFKYNPAEEIKKLKKPVLIVQGTTDIQVEVEEAEKLSASNPDARKVIIEGMNHVLKVADMNRLENIKTYSDPDLPLESSLVETIAGFIKEN